MSIKSKISSIAWRLFIWGLGITEDEYWEQIYQQEKHHKGIENSEYSQQEIKELRDKIHAISSKNSDEILNHFNDFLGYM